MLITHALCHLLHCLLRASGSGSPHTRVAWTSVEFVGTCRNWKGAGEAGTMSATLNVDAGQIVQLMLQFMKENGLVTSMKALQDETGVYLNTVDDPSLLEKRILAGKWDLVLQVRHAVHVGPSQLLTRVGLQEVSTLSLPTEVLMSLYEQVVLEMLELREMDTARSLLRNTAPMVHMKRADPERCVAWTAAPPRPPHARSSLATPPDM